MLRVAAVLKRRSVCSGGAALLLQWDFSDGLS